MLQAMNTGHDGSLTTLHANSPADVIQRLETMCQMSGEETPVASIHRMIVSAVDLVVQLHAGYQPERQPDGTVTRKRKRVVSEIAEVVGIDPDGHIVIKSLFARPAEGGPLRPTGYLPSFMGDLVDAGLAPDPLAFVRDAAPPPGGAP
jgi:Flp pilus assembly CpaF family ATPase